VLNWNGKQDTLECLDSIGKIAYQNLDVIVVDNGSNDDSVIAIQKKFPEVNILQTGKNLGYAGGNNYGIRHAITTGADYILILNNDIVVDPDLVKKFLEATLSVSELAIFAAKIYYFSQPQKIWYAGARRVGSTAHFTHIGQGSIEKDNQFNTIAETDYACGCAIFFDKKVIEKIGYFDEKFYLTYEEADFCYRARKEGVKSYIVPGAKIWHKVSISFGGEESPLFRYFISRNKLLWAEKNLPISQRFLIYLRACKEFLRLLLPPFRLSFTNDVAIKKKIISSFIEYKHALIKNYNDPMLKAKRWGLRDYFLRRFGECSESVRLTEI